MSFRSYMHIALDEARAAAARGEIPVGAVVIDADGQVVAQAGNRTRELSDPSAHAEILVIREACLRLGQERLTDHDLYITLEPCSMCAGLIAAARLRRLYYGATDEKSGGVGQGPRVFTHPQSHHRPEVISGISEADCAALLVDFFAQQRAKS